MMLLKGVFFQYKYDLKSIIILTLQSVLNDAIVTARYSPVPGVPDHQVINTSISQQIIVLVMTCIQSLSYKGLQYR